MLLIPFHRLTGGAFVRASVLALEGVPSKYYFDGTPSKAKTDARTNAPPVSRWNGMSNM